MTVLVKKKHHEKTFICLAVSTVIFFRLGQAEKVNFWQRLWQKSIKCLMIKMITVNISNQIIIKRSELTQQPCSQGSAQKQAAMLFTYSNITHSHINVHI